MLGISPLLSAVLSVTGPSLSKELESVTLISDTTHRDTAEEEGSIPGLSIGRSTAASDDEGGNPVVSISISLCVLCVCVCVCATECVSGCPYPHRLSTGALPTKSHGRHLAAGIWSDCDGVYELGPCHIHIVPR
jgi:hypothetical protein